MATKASPLSMWHVSCLHTWLRGASSEGEQKATDNTPPSLNLATWVIVSLFTAPQQTFDTVNLSLFSLMHEHPHGMLKWVILEYPLIFFIISKLKKCSWNVLWINLTFNYPLVFLLCPNSSKMFYGLTLTDPISCSLSRNTVFTKPQRIMISGKVTCCPYAQLSCYLIPPPPHMLAGNRTLYWWETSKEREEPIKE